MSTKCTLQFELSELIAIERVLGGIVLTMTKAQNDAIYALYIASGRAVEALRRANREAAQTRVDAAVQELEAARDELRRLS